MIGAIVWVVIFVALIIIAGKIPKASEEWLIIDTASIMFWIFCGVLVALRAFIRYVKH